jgi:hypothetical protein
MPEMAVYRSGSKTALPWAPALLRRSLASILVVIGLQGCGNEEPTEPKAGIKTVNSASNLVAGIHDDFTDTDGTLLQNHVPDGGTVPFSWVPATSWGGQFLQAVIQSNGVTSNPDMDWVYLTSVQAGDEAEIEVEVFGTPPSGRWQEIAIYFRTQDADVSELNGYIGPLWSLGSDSSFLEIQRPAAQGGVVIQRSGPVAVGSHRLRAAINSSGELEVSLDGAFIGKAPLGSLPPPARIGLGTWGTPVARITSVSDANEPPIRVVCSPSSPVRGIQVACTAELSPGAGTDLQVSKWRFFGLAVPSSITEQTSSTTWAGPAAFGGSVIVEGTVDGVAASGTGNFTVTARDWPQMQAVHVAKEVPAYELPVHPTADSLLGVTRSLTMGYAPPDRIVQVPSGPNKGWYYATKVPIKDSSEIQINRAALAKNSDFYKRHTATGNDGYCPRSEVTKFLPKAIAHEGVNLEVNSHSWSYGHGLDETIGNLVEGAVGPTPQDLAASARDMAGPATDDADEASAKVDELYPIPTLNNCPFHYY